MATACDPSEKEEVVTGDIDEDTTWDCGTYIIEEKVHVIDNSVLTIEPGVLVLGDGSTMGNPPALIVTRGSRLVAEGTAEEPIVFTSGKNDPQPGDFGGLVLLGDAVVNDGTCIDDGDDSTEACDAPGYLQLQIEGIPDDDERGAFGGTDNKSDCGSLKYVRIEYGGFLLGMDNELNGLTMGACGSDTKVSYVQVHRGKDDGIEVFGGTVGMDHILLTANEDDSLDWDNGWTGKVQYLIVHQFEGVGDKGFESDNLGSNETAEPTSNPEIWNVTMIGTSTTTAFHMKEGTLGMLRNFIVTGFATVLDLSYATVDPADIFMKNAGWSIKDSFFFDNEALAPAAADEMGTDPDASGFDDDQGFDELQALEDAIADGANALADDVDPMIDLGNDDEDPDYVPGADASDLEGATPGSGFDSDGAYAGAVEPGGDDWTDGWTAFPAGS